MAYGDFKDLTRRTASEKILRGKACSIAKNPKYDRNQRGLVLMVYKFFDKKTSGGINKNKNISIKELAEELRKPILTNSNRKSTLTFYRRYLECRSSRYVIDKQI